MMEIEEQIVLALEALGSTSAQVAENLVAQGYRGLRMDCDVCPVSNYLHFKFPELAFAVGPGFLSWTEWERPAPWWREIERMPSPVARFIEEFDNGGYDDLDMLAEYRANPRVFA